MADFLYFATCDVRHSPPIAAPTKKEKARSSRASTQIHYIVKLCQMPSNNFHDYKYRSACTACLPMGQFLLCSHFRTAVATVTYCHFVNYVITSRQMANTQTDEILFLKTAHHSTIPSMKCDFFCSVKHYN